MTGIIFRTLINAVALWVAAAIVPGMHIVGVGSLLLASLLLGFVNAVIRPIFIVLTLPITVVTLGLFLLFINAAMLKLVAMVLDGVSLDGLASAILASIVVSIVSTLASWFIGPRGRFEWIVVKRDR